MIGDPKIKQASKIDALYKKAKEVFNKYIRLRDKNELCITNNLLNCTKKVEHAVHCYSAAQFPSLEFDEVNVNGGCRICNYYNHTALSFIAHMKNIKDRHGIIAYDELCEKAVEAKKINFFKPDEDYYRNIIHTYQKKIAKLI